MEADMALNMLGEMEKEGCHVDIFHADNDSSTSGMLKSEFPNTIKMDDQNHVKKGFTKQLYELGKRYKELKQAEVIPYIQRCFAYAIQSNAGNSTKVEEDLDRIVPHIFGDHNKCSAAQWCTYNENPSSFRYKSLPGGRPLQNEDLKQELEDLVSKYRYRTENLSKLGSTQANESFNNLVATKAPKSRNYGGSYSLEQRLSAALLQKNEGYSYLRKVNEAASLSPGHHTIKLCDRIDKLRRERKDKVSTIKYKRRRLQLKKIKNKKRKGFNY
ncbi:uncharacterized protein LOC133180923 [Saccostrea echinata]|uniref:uncharacterized protein LOC133180923 n=1 Tax=Saccostrea echinata TaxID=191078 RepID=UPI002A7FEDF9|nr:uncharacterized protein LOC133180923 [Saccostrea echinata]